MTRTQKLKQLLSSKLPAKDFNDVSVLLGNLEAEQSAENRDSIDRFIKSHPNCKTVIYELVEELVG